MTIRLKRIIFTAGLGSRRDPWWWTTDAAGGKVYTIIGVQTARTVGTIMHYGGRCISLVLGPLHMVISLLDKEAA